MHGITPHHLRYAAVALLALVLLMGGCSRVALAYRNLDTLAALQLRSLVTLTTEQQADYERRFKTLWTWHRRSQLPLYADEIEALAAHAGRALTHEQIDAISRRARESAQLSLHRASLEAAPLLARLSDAQVKSLITKLEEQAAKRRRKQGGDDDRAWADYRRKRGESALQDWTGSVTPAQRERLRRWAEQDLRPLRAGIEAEERRQRAAFAQLLRSHRHTPDFAAQLERVLLRESAQDGPRRERGHALVADLSAMATPEQRQALQQRLQKLAADLRALSREERG